MPSQTFRSRKPACMAGRRCRTTAETRRRSRIFFVLNLVTRAVATEGLPTPGSRQRDARAVTKVTQETRSPVPLQDRARTYPNQRTEGYATFCALYRARISFI